MLPSKCVHRAAFAGTPLTPTFALATVAVLALSACESPTVPATDDPFLEPTSAEAVVAPALVPPPGGVPGCQSVQTLPTGALYQICWPLNWNGTVIAYAHGYVNPGAALAIPTEAADLAPFVLAQGFGFASTSYSVNGLAVKEGVQDMVALADKVRATAGLPVPILIAGASEGGAVTTRAAEGYPGIFQGALSTCGPTGNFQKQLDYFGDFNVLFNYFFPDVFGGKVTPEGVDPAVLGDWGAYLLAATNAVTSDPVTAAKLLKVAGVAVDPADPGAGLTAILNILRYNVFATNDAIAKLDGSGTPFDNRRRWYRGSGRDFHLNWTVQRVTGDPAARADVAAHYETTGDLDIPYVSLHTTGDEVVRFAQQPWYRLKALLSGSAWEHSALPIFRYGHCAFEEGDLELGLGLLMLKMGAATPTALAAAMPTPAARENFERLSKEKTILR